METKEKKDVKPEKKETTKGTKNKFNFSAEMKNAWRAFIRFMKPFSNLDKEVLMPKARGFLQQHIQKVYYVGCAILLVFAILALKSFPYILSILGQWIAVIVVFVFFRILCEIIVVEKTKGK